MKRSLFAIASLIGMCGVALAAPAPAGPRPGGPGGPGPGGPGMIERLQSEAGLSDEQVEQLRKVHMDERKQAIRTRADLEIARMELRELLHADTVDQAAIDARLKRIGELQAAMLRSKVDTQLAARKIMTKEQFEKARRVFERGPHGPRFEPPGHRKQREKMQRPRGLGDRDDDDDDERGDGGF